jgi:hypothetical protein
MDSMGPACFGLVIGWITYRTLRRRSGQPGLSDIATVIGAVGGGAVTGLFQGPGLFNDYAIGLALGFFGYFIVGLIFERSLESVGAWMGENGGRAANGGPAADGGRPEPFR